MKNLRMKKFTIKETKTSITTANVVIIPNESINTFITARAIAVASEAAEKNIANSMYQRNFPGRNTNLRFMTQQKTLATANPIAVATLASAPRVAYQASFPENSAAGSPRNRTMTSSEPKQRRHVAASK